MTSILCLGNFGSGKMGQYKVAELMLCLYKKYDIKFVIGLGNNILPNGVKNKYDSKFVTHFEKPYHELLQKIKFYNILGEVDYISRNSINSEINYNKWILPHNFYCFKKYINKIPVEFILIDSNFEKIKTKDKKTQEIWALNTLLESRSRWNIVISHHPWYSFGSTNCDPELNIFFDKLNNTKKVDLIISSHENNHQHIYIPNKPNMIISGVGAINDEYPIIKIYDELKFTSNELGCVMIHVTKNRLNVVFYNSDKQSVHSFNINKY